MRAIQSNSAAAPGVSLMRLITFVMAESPFITFVICREVRRLGHDGGVLKSLVITSDVHLVGMVQPALRRLEFELDVKPTIAEGMDKMRYQRYCAVLVDCTAGCLRQIDQSRNQWLNRDSTIIAIAPTAASTYEQVPGADTILTQPLRDWEIYRTLLNVRTQHTGGDRRLRKRYALPAQTPLKYSYDGQQFYEARVIDVTESGVAIEGTQNLDDGHVVKVQFKLPAMLSRIETMADVVWRAGRRAGLHFVELPEAQQKQLERWLRNSRLGMSTGYSFAS